jgi:hypothetical protein
MPEWTTYLVPVGCVLAIWLILRLVRRGGRMGR